MRHLEPVLGPPLTRRSSSGNSPVVAVPLIDHPSQPHQQFARYLRQVTKAHLVDQIVDSTQLEKQDCEKIVSSLFATITAALQAGERIDIQGFGTFKVKDQAARQARNPRTGEAVSVPAKKVAAFKPSNEIAELLNPASQTAVVE